MICNNQMDQKKRLSVWNDRFDNPCMLQVQDSQEFGKITDKEMNREKIEWAEAEGLDCNGIGSGYKTLIVG